MKKLCAILMSALMCAALMTSCGSKGASDGNVTSADTAAGDYGGAVKISLSDAGCGSSGDGVRCDGGDVTVTQSGRYVISGTVSNGRITVDSDDDGEVELILDGAVIASSDGPAIYVKKADSVKLTLAAGSTNSVSDGESYDMSDDGSVPDGAIFSKDDLAISGTGGLTVNGAYKHGIVSKDTLVISGGEISVTSQKTGICGKDSVEITGGTVTVNAGSDGIKSDNSEDAALGYVKLTGGVLDITAGCDGVQAESDLYVEGGTVTLRTGDGSENASVHTDGTVNDSWGKWSSVFGSSQTDGDDSSDSAKGLKAGNSITVSGGSVTIDSSDDAVHSNGNITMSGGTVTAASGDDGFHADSELSITDGIISITDSYEGLEASVLSISGGRIGIRASDDGLNAAGGSDSSSIGNRPGAGMFSSSTGEIYISGGYIYVDADGDGIDSNGSLSVTGGTVLVCGPTSDGDGALDYDGTATVEGGVIVAIGSSGMMQGFSEASGQGAIACTFDSQSAGTPIVLTDSDGNVIASLTSDKAYSSAVISAPGLEVGGSYRLVAGVSHEGADEHGFADGGTVDGGTVLCEIELTSSIYQSEGLGGGAPGGMSGNMGGMTPPGGAPDGGMPLVPGAFGR